MRSMLIMAVSMTWGSNFFGASHSSSWDPRRLGVSKISGPYVDP